MNDLIDKLALLDNCPDFEEIQKHADNMRDALAHVVVQTHIENTFGAYDQVFCGVQFFAELAYRLAPSREIARSTLEMAVLEGERDYFAKAIGEAKTPEDRERMMREVEFLDKVIIKRQSEFLENAEVSVDAKKDDSTKEKKDAN